MTCRTTRWSLVLQATGGDPERQRALQELCALYRPAVYTYYRHCGRDADTAEDLTQGLFLHLLERGDFAKADPERGRFRSYLRTCARHFASNERAAAHAHKRGGGGPAPAATDLAVDRRTPEQEFERRFACALLDDVLDRLGTEYAARGNGELFAALRGYLEVGGGPGVPVTAGQLGSSEGAVRVAVHRLRRRFRELLLCEVRHTLADPGDAADELTQLLAALRGCADHA